LRFAAKGCSRMILFDVVLVLVGTVADTIQQLHESSKTILVFRVFRLIRLTRVLKTVRHFNVLWRLVAGLLNSASAMLSTFVILLLTVFTAACFAIELISKDALLRVVPETKAIIDTNFSSLSIIMVSLVQFVTMDGLADIYLPLVKRHAYLMIYFGLLIAIVSVTLMNLVTALLVEGAIASTKRNKKMEQEKLRQLRPVFLQAFRNMDENGDKILTRRDIALRHSHWPEDVLEIVPKSKLFDFFDVLDLDESGKVAEEEFVEALEHLALSKVSFKSMENMKVLRQIRNRQAKSLTLLNNVDARLKRILQCTPTPIV